MVNATPEDELVGLLRTCRAIYKQHGVQGLRYQNLDKRLYHKLYRHGIRQSDLLKLLGAEEEFAQAKAQETRWSWSKIVEVARPIVERNRFLPTAGWFQKNGHSGMVVAIYELGQTWGDLRGEFASFEASTFVTSRSGQRWLSHPEASLSNFLYARGVPHRRGQKYPAGYAQFSGKRYGYYDLEFTARNRRTIQVEVWGHKPNGHDASKYAAVRKKKTDFHANSRTFVGIDFEDCFQESKLTQILAKYIGIIEPFVFDEPQDPELPSTNWSNADEVIAFCRTLVQEIPGGKLPTEDWLRKRGRWRKRPGVAYNTLAIYILKWVGGFRKLRMILGQPEHSTLQWNRETAIAAYAKVYSDYGLTTGQIRGKVRRGQLNLDELERRRINNIDAAAMKYVGSTHDMNQMLGIPTRKKANRGL